MALKNIDLKNVFDKVEDIAEEIMSDKALQKKFKEEPVKALEQVLDVNLPDAQVEKLIKLVKAKIAAEGLDDKLDDIGDKLEGFLGKLNK